MSMKCGLFVWRWTRASIYEILYGWGGCNVYLGCGLCMLFVLDQNPMSCRLGLSLL